MNYIFSALIILLTVAVAFALFRSLKMSKKSVELIEKYENDKSSPELIKEIYEFIKKDFRLKKILEKYNADEKEISKLHAKLMKWGDFRKYNRYVPITSFFNTTTLEYLLEHKSDDPKSLTEKMMNHFHF